MSWMNTSSSSQLDADRLSSSSSVHSIIKLQCDVIFRFQPCIDPMMSFCILQFTQNLLQTGEERITLNE